MKKSWNLRQFPFVFELEAAWDYCVTAAEKLNIGEARQRNYMGGLSFFEPPPKTPGRVLPALAFRRGPLFLQSLVTAKQAGSAKQDLTLNGRVW